MKNVLKTLIFALALVACGQPQSVAVGEDRVEQFGPDDATMNAAIAEARTGLPRFWELFDAHDGSDFMLKVAFPTPDGGNEHIWVGDIERTPEGLTAVIQNEPENVPTLRLGARAPIDETLISDWALTRNGHMYGHYTTRVVVGSLSPEEQAQYAGFLANITQGVP
ncbi:MAG: DUF2314 domain-containing protein [Terricaulis sp.]